MMSVEEKKNLCARCLITWSFDERRGEVRHDPEAEDIFIYKMLSKKFKSFGVDIVLPDPLVLILDLCCDSNPGQVQIILKDLLNDIKKRSGKPIPKGYVITSTDFSMCFPISFPITAIEHINKKYMKLWDKQKRETKNVLESDNKCDTAEWWLEVME